MKFGSLFSGIGGFDLGFERAGMTCAWQCELDKHASAVLTTHWPNVRREKDVRQIGKHNLESVDLICGGFPCQDLSVAGNRAGLAGGRSGLWWEFHRVLSELLPRWVVIENVPGLLSSDKGRDMGLLLGALAQLGYGWAYRVLDAQYFGVAQRRRRVFIVGCLGDWHGAAQVLFEPESGRRDTPPRRKAGKGITGSLTARAGKNGGGANDDVDAGRVVPVGLIPRKTNMPFESDIVPTMHMGNGGHGGPAVAFGGNNTSGEIAVSTALNAHPSGRYDFESETFVTNIFGGNKRKDRPHGGFYVEDASTSKTLDVSGLNPVAQQGGTLVGGVRRLTPTECERLQGFPDGWTAGQADTQRYKQLGNAVAVPVLTWLGTRLLNENKNPR